MALSGSVARFGRSLLRVEVVVLSGEPVRHPDGRPMLCVGGELSASGEEFALCVVAKEDAFPFDGETEARQVRGEVVRALSREDTAKRRRDQLERERDAMLAAMKRAVALLPHELAQEIRGIYGEAMKA